MHITAEKDNIKRTPRHILSQLPLAVLLHGEKTRGREVRKVEKPFMITGKGGKLIEIVNKHI
jgi:hypothetical protein